MEPTILVNDEHIGDTAEMMTSPDYKERFKAEYIQLTIRISKLAKMLADWVDGELDFTPTCPFELLRAQLSAMQVYRYTLIERAKLEGIEL